jgi:thiol-disulfide isomerase/thioredoxin
LGVQARRWLLVALVVVLGSVPGGRARKAVTVEGGKLVFELHNLDGNLVGSDDERFKGKVVLVDVFGTWCPPCLRAIPTFRTLQLLYRKEGLVIVGIAFEHGDSTRERRNYLRSFVEHQGINYLILDGGTPEQFRSALPGVDNVKGFPVEILIGRDGEVIEARNANVYKKSWARELEARLVEALDGAVEPGPSGGESR